MLENEQPIETYWYGIVRKVIAVAELRMRCSISYTGGRSHSANFDHRRRPETLRTAMAMAFFCPTNTTSRFPLVTPV